MATRPGSIAAALPQDPPDPSQPSEIAVRVIEEAAAENRPSGDVVQSANLPHDVTLTQPSVSNRIEALTPIESCMGDNMNDLVPLCGIG